jgi:hypothetical protein
MKASEYLPLVGVVIGAILGGGAQLVADALRSKRERAERRVDRKHEAYLAVFNVCREMAVLMREMAFEHPPKDGTVARLRVVMDDLYGCLTLASLYCSDELMAAGAKVYAKALDLLGSLDPAGFDAWADAHHALLQRMRLEIGR